MLLNVEPPFVVTTAYDIIEIVALFTRCSDRTNGPSAQCNRVMIQGFLKSLLIGIGRRERRCKFSFIAGKFRVSKAFSEMTAMLITWGKHMIWLSCASKGISRAFSSIARKSMSFLFTEALSSVQWPT